MVYILLGNGFEEIEAASPYDVLKRGGVPVMYAGIGGKTVTGAHGLSVNADCLVTEADPSAAEMLIIPGGLGGVESIEHSPEALTLIAAAHARGAQLAAICAGPRVLAGLGLLKGKNAVCYPGMEGQMTGGIMSQKTSTVRDGALTTGRAPGASIDFALRVLEALRGRAAAEAVAKEMCYEY